MLNNLVFSIIGSAPSHSQSIRYSRLRVLNSKFLIPNSKFKKGSNMNFNDEQLPDENSIRQMQRSYAGNIRALQNEENANNTAPPTTTNPIATDNDELNTIANNIDWETNLTLLNNLLARTQNRCMRGFIRGLIPLDEKDRDEINSFYTNNRIRRNPSIIGNMPNIFGVALRDYIRNEAELLDGLTQLLYTETDEARKTSIYNIIRRRLDALDTIASFWSSGFFA